MNSIGAKALIAQAIADGTVRSIGADLNLLQDILSVLPDAPSDSSKKMAPKVTPYLSTYYGGSTRQNLYWAPWITEFIKNDVSVVELGAVPGMITDLGEPEAAGTGNLTFNSGILQVSLDIVDFPDVVFSMNRLPRYMWYTTYKDGVVTPNVRGELTHSCDLNFGYLNNVSLQTKLNAAVYGATESYGIHVDGFSEFFQTSYSYPVVEIDKLSIHKDSSFYYLDEWKGRVRGHNSQSLVTGKMRPVYLDEHDSVVSFSGNWYTQPQVSFVSDPDSDWYEFELTNPGSAFFWPTRDAVGDCIGAAFMDCVDYTTGNRPTTGVMWTKI